MLAWFFIRDNGQCGCKSRARQMDAWGPDRCREKIETILDWLQEASAKRGLPFLRFGARWIVNAAIDRAVRSRQLGDQEESMVTTSVIIPARNEVFLQRTIDDLCEHLETDFEIVVGLDDYSPDPPLRENPRVVVYRAPERMGMRPLINRLVGMATGKYIMKLDAHCRIDQGYDRKLIEIYQPGCVVLGVRYELDTQKWERRERTNCDFRYLSNPDVDPLGGLRGTPWPEYAERVKDQDVAETMTISGSAYLLDRDLWNRWGDLDERHGTFGQEGAEICCRAWLSGGRVLVNRQTWYAHWNRGKSPYSLGTSQRDKSVAHSCDLWMNDKWPLQKYSFSWLLKHFAPVPGWPETADEILHAPRQGTLYKGLRSRLSQDKTDIPIAELWLRRPGISEPAKKHRLKIFFDSFAEFCEQLAAGVKFTDEELTKTPYFHYLTTHLPPASRDPVTAWGRKHCLKKIADSIRLFENIKAFGLKAPLECYSRDRHLILWKGYRRLVIAKALGFKTIPIVLHHSEKSAKSLPPKFPPAAPGSITELGQRQFQKLGGKATDKYWVHEYLPIYDQLFADQRHRPLKILEIGVYRGASLALWRDAFPKATIFGLDKDRSIWKELTPPDCRVFVGKQQNVKFLKGVAKRGPFDIIIDDCGHIPENQRVTFEALWPHVAKGGWYVVEDTYVSYKRNHRDKFNLPRWLATWIDKLYLGHTVGAVLFYYNLCALRKNF